VDSRQRIHGDVKLSAKVVVPLEGSKVHEHRPASVGHVGRVDLPAREILELDFNIQPT
jgi:hypothetical protein